MRDDEPRPVWMSLPITHRVVETLRMLHCDHVDISQTFVRGDLLPGDGYNGKVYIQAMMKTQLLLSAAQTSLWDAECG
jgi:hypothetical protein